uniref:Uncharacterized protein n=1 Tax=Arundo donax TaxID=35708 RepID=A0A0A9ESE4_ARUDO
MATATGPHGRRGWGSPLHFASACCSARPGHVRGAWRRSRAGGSACRRWGGG